MALEETPLHISIYSFLYPFITVSTRWNFVGVCTMFFFIWCDFFVCKLLLAISVQAMFYVKNLCYFSLFDVSLWYFFKPFCCGIFRFFFTQLQLPIFVKFSWNARKFIWMLFVWFCTFFFTFFCVLLNIIRALVHGIFYVFFFCTFFYGQRLIKISKLFFPDDFFKIREIRFDE